MKVSQILAEIDRRTFHLGGIGESTLLQLRDWILKNQSRKGYDKAYYAKNKTRIKVRNSK